MQECPEKRGTITIGEKRACPAHSQEMDNCTQKYRTTQAKEAVSSEKKNKKREALEHEKMKNET